MAVTAQVNVKIDSAQASKTVGQLNQDVSNAAKSANSLRAELRQTIQELQNLQPGTARFQELSLRAGELRDQIADTNAVVGQLAGNVAERLTRGITGVVSVGVAGFQTIAASAALFGVESEELTQTLVKLNALMNLSQAIETFAGLDQKIVEIRSAFQSLTTSTVAQTVATEGQAVANVAATTTTTALGVAMKALPIIAIVAGLGTLVYGLYQYATANSEATQKEKEAAKQREILEKRTKELEKAQDEDRKQVAASSVEYFNLIQRLKETNAGSKERDKLIKQINTEYGTTLQNLKDETAFQSQLNLSVKEYIALQVLKVKQESNKKNEEKAINNLVKAQQNLNKFQKEYAGMTEKEISDYDIRNYGVSVYRDTLIKLNGELDNAQKRAQNYAITNGKLQEEIDKLQVDFPDLTNKTKDNTNSTKDATDATDKYAEALARINSILTRNEAASLRASELLQLQNIAVQQEEGIAIVDELGNVTVEMTQKSVEAAKKRLEVDKNYYNEIKQLVDQATKNEIDAIEDKFVQGKLNEQEFITEREKILQKGITKLTQQEVYFATLLQKQRQADLEDIDAFYKSRDEIAITQTEILNNEIERITLESQKQLDIKSIEQSILSEEEKNEQILQIKRKYLDIETQNILDNAKLQVRLLEQQRDEQLRTFEGSTEERVQIETDYNNKIVKINQDAQGQIQGLIEETSDVQQSQLDKLQENLDTIDDYLAAVQSLFSDFESALTNLTEQNAQRRTKVIQDSLDAQTQILDSQLQSRLITQEEYDNKVLQLQQEQEQQEKALAKKSFQTNKALNLVGATIDGARAVISTFANTPGELIIKSIAAALAGVFAATQIGIIARSKFTAADGGIVPGMGSGEIDSVSATLAPGEAVINSKSTSQFLPVLDAINQANGGRSLMPNLPATNQNQRFEVVFPDNKQQQPVRAYVVESDISDAQRRVNRIENSTRF
jgi:hypothetical protein